MKTKFSIPSTDAVALDFIGLGECARSAVHTFILLSNFLID